MPSARPTIITALLAALMVASACAADSSGATAALPSQTHDLADSDVAAAATAFVQDYSSSTADSLVTAISHSGKERWVPWLVDLLRLNVSTNVSARTAEVLADITGTPSTSRIPDLIAYGSWAASAGIDGGPGYREFKAALYGRIDPQFAALLDSVNDQTELAAIQWGGVPVGGIPELNHPDRVPAAAAGWMTADEVVLGVIVDDHAVAYPLRILARHELANDTIGGQNLAVVYCTLCKSAIVFERDVAGHTLSFLTSGLLSNSNKIMLDTETETLWSHLRGVGIGGELVGVELTRRSVNHMRWSDWVSTYPHTEVLSLPAPIFFDDPERAPIAYDYTPGAAYLSYYDNPDVWFPIVATPDVFPAKTEVVGISANGDSLAVALAAISELNRPVEVDVGGELFRIESTQVGALVFNADGDRVVAEQSFWFAWFANHPDSRTLSSF